MRVVVGEEQSWSVGVLECSSDARNITPLLHYSIAPLPYGAVRNFCRTRSSGYFGKKTSAIKTLFGVSSRVAIVSA